MPWWDAPKDRTTHEVIVPCLCGDPEWCVTERYIADIRTLITLQGDPLADRPNSGSSDVDNPT